MSEPVAPKPTRPPWSRLVLRHPAVGPLLALVLAYGLFVILAPDTFGRAANLTTMARQTVVVSLAAVGMTMVIAHGGIDLSVGSSVAFGTVVIASLLKAGHGPWVSCAGGMLACSLAGLVVGGLITRLRVAPFIVTLGAMSLLRGAAKGLAHEAKIDAEPRGIDTLLSPSSGLLPVGVWVALLVAALVAALLRYTRFGRHVFAVGSSEATARLCGVQVERVKMTVYALAGLLTGLASVMEFSTLTVGDPTDSVGLELDAIAAVVIGGASLSGGQGSVAGTLVGAFFMTVLKTGATHLGWPNWVQEIVTGLVIVVAVAVDRLRQQKA